MNKINFIFYIIIFLGCAKNETKNMRNERLAFLIEKREIKKENTIFISALNEIPPQKIIYKGIYCGDTENVDGNIYIKLKSGYEEIRYDKVLDKSESKIYDKELIVFSNHIFDIDNTLKSDILKIKISKIKKFKQLNNNLLLPVIVKQEIERENKKNYSNNRRFKKINNNYWCIYENISLDKIYNDYLILNNENLSYNNFLLIGQNLDINIDTTIIDKYIKNTISFFLEKYLKQFLVSESLISIFKNYLENYLRFEKQTTIKVLRNILERRAYKKDLKKHLGRLDNLAYFDLVAYFIRLTYDNPKIDWKITIQKVKNEGSFYYLYLPLFIKKTEISSGSGKGTDIKTYNFITRPANKKGECRFNKPLKNGKFMNKKKIKFNYIEIDPQEIKKIFFSISDKK